MKSEWQQYTVGDICTIKHGFAFKGIHFCEEQTKYIVTTPGNFALGGGFKLDKPKYYNGPIPEDFILSPGDIIVTMTDLSKEGDTLGYSALVPSKDDGIFLHNQRIGLIENISPEIDKTFLYWMMRTHSYQRYVANHSSGSTVRHSSPTNIGRYKFYAPSICKQRKIGSILTSYDDLIENYAKRIKLLEEMAEHLYKEWFVRFRFPGYELSMFEHGIPKDWEFLTVEELSSVLRRGISPAYDPDGAFTVINQKCIRTDIVNMSEAQKQTKPYKIELNLQDGDTVICSTGTGTLGRVGKVFGHYENTTFDSHVSLVRANGRVGKHFLFHSLKELQPWLMNMGIGSTNQQELYRSTIKSAKVRVPKDTKLLHLFEQKIDDIHNQIRILRDTIMNLTKQRDRLLPRLMRGELDV